MRRWGAVLARAAGRALSSDEGQPAPLTSSSQVAVGPALRSPDRPRLSGRIKGAYGVASDGAGATFDPTGQPSKAAATKGTRELWALVDSALEGTVGGM